MKTKSEKSNFCLLNETELKQTTGGGIIDTIKAIIDHLKNPLDFWI
ncbi:MAG: bacteriocin [Proteiniphilum sp.]|jgi:bacteriocin-like protein|nr:bacteriocin [Proteiniphilum sp.]MEA5127956.1 bacteriocin [Proteiniphilum sp.]